MTPDWIRVLNVQPGDHVLAIITDEEDISLLPPYAQDGLEKNHLCSVMATEGDTPRVRKFIGDAGVDVEKYEEAEQLSFADPTTMGRREDGSFDTEFFLQNLEGFVNSLADQGVEHLRSMGSMSWLPEAASAEDGIYMCARINEIFKGKPISGMCIWDSRQFGGDIIVQALRTHPKILLKGEVTLNPLYKQPHEVIAELGRR